MWLLTNKLCYCFYKKVLVVNYERTFYISCNLPPSSWRCSEQIFLGIPQIKNFKTMWTRKINRWSEIPSQQSQDGGFEKGFGYTHETSMEVSWVSRRLFVSVMVTLLVAAAKWASNSKIACLSFSYNWKIYKKLHFVQY